MTTQYSHCSKGIPWHFYNSNFFPCLLVHCYILEPKQDSGGWSRAWCLSGFPKHAPVPLVRLGAFASFPERVIALPSKECKALWGISQDSWLKDLEGELRLAHQALRLVTHKSRRSCTVRLWRRSALDQEQERESRDLSLPNRQAECRQATHLPLILEIQKTISSGKQVPGLQKGMKRR